MKSKTVYLYTDGSSLGNPGPGGYGIILEWAGMSYVKEFSQGFVRTTNNRMELLAVIVGLLGLVVSLIIKVISSEADDEIFPELSLNQVYTVRE